MNHHAQRLLVAASRGARIYDSHFLSTTGHCASTLFNFAACDDYTIHPDDIACQYGPIATELRKMTIDDCYCSSLPFGAMAISFVRDINFDVFTVDDDHFSWLCLFAAELAADEGM